MPRRIRDAKLRNSRPTRQEHLDRNEEEINVGYLLTCGDCGTTDNVGESGFCASCEADFDEILESMNDVEEDEFDPEIDIYAEEDEAMLAAIDEDEEPLTPEDEASLEKSIEEARTTKGRIFHSATELFEFFQEEDDEEP